MKKKSLMAILVTLVMTGCMTMGGGGLLGGIDTTNTLGNVIVSVLGINKVSAESLVGTWRYSGPGCAFTSDNLLAKAGGEVAASKIKSELLPYYQQLGINGSNTSFTFNQDKTFSAKLNGQSINGTYTYDPNNGQIAFKTLLLSLNGYVTRSVNGVNLLFESKKILSVMQTLGSLSGNATVSTISDISKNYSGVRVGFDMIR